MQSAETSSRRRIIIGLLIFFYALGLRVLLLGKHPFHMDEALYASFSQRIVHGDLLLSSGLNNDKPPLQPYLGALGMALFGDSETAPRFMNSVLSALECATLSWFLWPMVGSGLALVAGMLLAGSPLMASYGASAVMDGPVSFFLLLSFCLAASSRPQAAGFSWGLAGAFKQIAWFFGPFFLLAAVLASYAPRAALRRFVVGAVWVLAPVLIWSALFQHPRLGMILLMRSNQPEVGPVLLGLFSRLRTWMSMTDGVFALPWIFKALFFSGMVACGWLAWKWKHQPERRAWSLAGLFPLLALLLFAFLRMREFDRYLLPLASFTLLAAFIPLGLVMQRRWRVMLSVPLLVGLVLLNRDMQIPPTQQGAAGFANDGYDQMALELQRLEPQGGSLYSAKGGTLWLSAFYLGKKWHVTESQNPAALMGAMEHETAAHFYFIAVIEGGRKGSAPSLAGRVWRSLGIFGNFELFCMDWIKKVNG